MDLAIIRSNEAFRDGRRDLLLDVKGWSNRSPEALQFWAALLETPWRDEVVSRFLQGAIKPPVPPRSPT